MCCVLLLLAALISDSAAALPENDTGLEFLFAFPENIAYYHPDSSKNKVQITALYNNTVVTINPTTKNTLSAGETWVLALDADLELWDQDLSNSFLKITSSKSITVSAVNLRNNSLQTGLVIPTDKLVTQYLIPPVPTISGTTDPASMVTTTVTERSPFKLIIINTDQVNQVTVAGAVPSEFLLQPNEIAQIWVNDSMQTVIATKPVVVLFGHSCAIRYNCTCGLLYTSLQPASDAQLTFYIPQALTTNAENQTFVLVSEANSTKVLPFNPKSPMVNTAGTAVLYRPGLLLNLIAETDFVACSVINSILDAQSFAVIVVNKDLTSEVNVGNLPPESPQWQPLTGTDYVSTQVVLASGKNVIWHASSVMAVYFVGYNGHTMIGNPAPIISQIPDFRGCVLSPEVVTIGEVAMSWTESVQYCQDQKLGLVTFPSAQLAQQIYNKISQAKTKSLQEVWIGMRRSSLNGEWYWVDQTPVIYTNWAKGEPGTVLEGQCAIMSLKNNMNFGWADNDCCMAAQPVCYRAPALLPV